MQRESFRYFLYERRKAKKSLFFKAICIILLAAFTLNDFAYAAPTAIFLPKALENNPHALKIPSQAARITEIYQGKVPRFIIHIQDAHTNPSAQANIAKVLEELIKRYEIQSIFLEGGTKNDSLTFLRPRAGKNRRERIAKKYLLDGQLNGAEYLNLSSDYKMSLLGVEKPSLYEENLKTYGRLAGTREAILNYIDEITKRAESLKRRMYSKEALGFDAIVGKLEKKEMPFTQYYEETARLCEAFGLNLLGYPNFLLLKELEAKENQIDFVKANEEAVKLSSLAAGPAAAAAHFLTSVPLSEKERSAFASPAATKTSVDRDNLSRRGYAEGLEKLKSGSYTPVNFYEELISKVKENKTDPRAYENVKKYLDYLKLYSAMNMDLLLQETKALEAAIYERLLPDEDARTLYEISNYLKVLRSLFRLQISKEHFIEYSQKQMDKRFSTMVFLAFLNKKLYDLGRYGDVIEYLPLIDQNKKEVENFYLTTERRDEVFVDKALKRMEKENIPVAVLVTGGYHTPNLRELMKARGISYAVVTPQVDYETDLGRYEKLLLGQLGNENPLKKPTFDASHNASYIPVRPVVERVSALSMIQMDFRGAAEALPVAAARLAAPYRDDGASYRGLFSPTLFIDEVANVVGRGFYWRERRLFWRKFREGDYPRNPILRPDEWRAVYQKIREIFDRGDNFDIRVSHTGQLANVDHHSSPLGIVMGVLPWSATVIRKSDEVEVVPSKGARLADGSKAEHWFSHQSSLDKPAERLKIEVSQLTAPSLGLSVKLMKAEGSVLFENIFSGVNVSDVHKAAVTLAEEIQSGNDLRPDHLLERLSDIIGRLSAPAVLAGARLAVDSTKDVLAGFHEVDQWQWRRHGLAAAFYVFKKLWSKGRGMLVPLFGQRVDLGILKGKTFIITGGLGYIGKAWTALYLDLGANVHVIDNFEAVDFDKGVLQADISHFAQQYPHNFSYSQVDLGDEAKVRAAFQTAQDRYEQPIAGCLHLAAYIEAGVSMERPGRFLRNNVMNTLKLLKIMRELEVKPLVFASSAGVYEGKQLTALDEDDLIGPQNLYGATKLLMEKLMAAMGMDYVALRFFNAAGAFKWRGRWLGERHNPESHLIPLVIWTAFEKFKIKIFGKDYRTPDGSNIRDYVDIRDLADAAARSMALLLAKDPNAEPINHSMNLGQGRGLSNFEMVRLVQEATGKAVNFIQDGRRGGDGDILIAGFARAWRILGWFPFHRTVEIVRNAVHWHEHEVTEPPKARRTPIPAETDEIRQVLLVMDELGELLSNELKFEILLRLYVISARPFEKADQAWKTHDNEVKNEVRRFYEAATRFLENLGQRNIFDYLERYNNIFGRTTAFYQGRRTTISGTFWESIDDMRSLQGERGDLGPALQEVFDRLSAIYDEVKGARLATSAPIRPKKAARETVLTGLDRRQYQVAVLEDDEETSTMEVSVSQGARRIGSAQLLYLPVGTVENVAVLDGDEQVLKGLLDGINVKYDLRFLSQSGARSGRGYNGARLADQAIFTDDDTTKLFRAYTQTTRSGLKIEARQLPGYQCQIDIGLNRRTFYITGGRRAGEWIKSVSQGRVSEVLDADHATAVLLKLADGLTMRLQLTRSAEIAATLKEIFERPAAVTPKIEIISQAGARLSSLINRRFFLSRVSSGLGVALGLSRLGGLRAASQATEEALVLNLLDGRLAPSDEPIHENEARFFRAVPGFYTVDDIYHGECCLVIINPKNNPDKTVIAHLAQGRKLSGQDKAYAYSQEDIRRQSERLRQFLIQQSINPNEAIFHIVRYGPSFGKVGDKAFSEYWKQTLSGYLTEGKDIEITGSPDVINGEPATRFNVLRFLNEISVKLANGAVEVRAYASAYVRSQRKEGSLRPIVSQAPALRARFSPNGVEYLEAIPLSNEESPLGFVILMVGAGLIGLAVNGYKTISHLRQTGTPLNWRNFRIEFIRNIKSLSGPSDDISPRRPQGARLAKSSFIPKVIAFVGFEGVAKVGGQFDYMRDVAQGLAAEGKKVYIVTPGLDRKPNGTLQDTFTIRIKMGYGELPMTVQRWVDGNITRFVLVDQNEAFFKRRLPERGPDGKIKDPGDPVYKDPDGIRGLTETVILSQALFRINQALLRRGEDLGIDVVHVNDWQAGSALVLLKTLFKDEWSGAAGVFTSHNMAYQGVFNGYLVGDKLDEQDNVVTALLVEGRINAEADEGGVIERLVKEGVLKIGKNIFNKDGKTIIQIVPDADDPESTANLLYLPHQIIVRSFKGLEFWKGPTTGNKFSFLGALEFADKMNAVSRGSEEEMTRPESEGGTAFGFDPVIRHMKAEGRLTHVFNGTSADPRTEKDLTGDGYTNFDPEDSWALDKIRQNGQALRAEIRERFHFNVADSDYMLTSVGRIATQKGIQDLDDTFFQALRDMARDGRKVKLVLMGSGDEKIPDEKILLERLRDFAKRHSDVFLFIEAFDPKLANRMYAGGDLFIMPSRQEPAGIAMQIANKFGQPVAAPLVGGLNDFFGEWDGSGWAYPNVRPHTAKMTDTDWGRRDALLVAIRQAADMFFNDPSSYAGKRGQATEYDGSWKSRIKKYFTDVYGPALQSVRGARISFTKRVIATMIGLFPIIMGQAVELIILNKFDTWFNSSLEKKLFSLFIGPILLIVETVLIAMLLKPVFRYLFQPYHREHYSKFLFYNIPAGLVLGFSIAFLKATNNLSPEISTLVTAAIFFSYFTIIGIFNHYLSDRRPKGADFFTSPSDGGFNGARLSLIKRVTATVIGLIPFALSHMVLLIALNAYYFRLKPHVELKVLSIPTGTAVMVVETVILQLLFKPIFKKLFHPFDEENRGSYFVWNMLAAFLVGGSQALVLAMDNLPQLKIMVFWPVTILSYATLIAVFNSYFSQRRTVEGDFFTAPDSETSGARLAKGDNNFNGIEIRVVDPSKRVMLPKSFGVKGQDEFILLVNPKEPVFEVIPVQTWRGEYDKALKGAATPKDRASIYARYSTYSLKVTVDKVGRIALVGGLIEAFTSFWTRPTADRNVAVIGKGDRFDIDLRGNNCPQLKALSEIKTDGTRLAADMQSSPLISREILHQRPGYVGTYYQIPASGSTNPKHKGKATIRLFEVFEFNLLTKEAQYLIDQVKKNPNCKVVLLNPDVFPTLEEAQKGRKEIVLDGSMGIIPAKLLGQKILLGENCPFILENPQGDAKAFHIENFSADQLPAASEIRISASCVYRIKVGDKYLLTFNRSRMQSGDQVASPIGGTYLFMEEAGKALYQAAGISMSAGKRHSLAMSQFVPRDQAAPFIQMFVDGIGREISSIRELVQELAEEGLFLNQLPENVAVAQQFYRQYQQKEVEDYTPRDLVRRRIIKLLMGDVEEAVAEEELLKLRFGQGFPTGEIMREIGDYSQHPRKRIIQMIMLVVASFSLSDKDIREVSDPGVAEKVRALIARFPEFRAMALKEAGLPVGARLAFNQSRQLAQAVLQFTESLKLTPNQRTDVREAILARMRREFPDTKEMIPSFATAPTEADRKRLPRIFIDIDSGGTNLRVVLKQIDDNGQFHTIEGAAFYYKFRKKDKIGDADQLFDLIAKAVKKITNTRPAGFYDVELTWSDPIEQISADDGIFGSLSKNWKLQNFTGKKAKKSIESAFERNGVTNVRLVRVQNDTIRTLLRGAWRDPNCTLGIVAATGFNIGLFSRLLRNGKRVGRPQKDHAEAVNGEVGNQSVDEAVRTPIDRIVDQKSTNPGEGQLEKLISSSYLAALLDRQIKIWRKEGLLFAGQKPEGRASRFSGKYLSRIAKDNSKGLHEVGRVLAEMGFPKSNLSERKAIKAITEAVLGRSAILLAESAAAGFRFVDPALQRQQAAAFESPLWDFVSGYREAFLKAFGEISWFRDANLTQFSFFSVSSDNARVFTAGQGARLSQTVIAAIFRRGSRDSGHAWIPAEKPAGMTEKVTGARLAYTRREFLRKGVLGAATALFGPTFLTQNARALVVPTPLAPITSLAGWAHLIKSQTTRLPSTYYVPANYADPDAAHKFFIEQTGGLYDNMIGVLTLIQNGDLAAAETILRKYSQVKNGSYDLMAYPNSSNGYAFEPLTIEAHLIFNQTKADGTLDARWNFWNAHTGPNAWFLIAVAAYVDAVRSKGGTPDSVIVEKARKVGNAILLLQVADGQQKGGVRYGPKKQYTPGRDQNFAYNFLNTENNISAYAGLMALYRATGDFKYRTAADAIASWLKVSEVSNFLKTPGSPAFYISVGMIFDGNRWNPEQTFATDAAGTWAISAFGPQWIDAQFGTGMAYKIWQTIRLGVGITSDYRKAGANDAVAGVDFTVMSPLMISPEWTAGAIEALMAILDYYAVSDPQGNVVPLADREKMMIDVRAMREFIRQHPNPYAIGPRVATGVTGVGWVTPLSDQVTALPAAYAHIGDPLRRAREIVVNGDNWPSQEADKFNAWLDALMPAFTRPVNQNGGGFTTASMIKDKARGYFVITLTKPGETRVLRIRLGGTRRAFEIDITNDAGQVTSSQGFYVDRTGTTAVLNGQTIWSSTKPITQDGLFVTKDGAISLYVSGQDGQTLAASPVGSEFVGPRPLRYRLESGEWPTNEAHQLEHWLEYQFPFFTKPVTERGGAFSAASIEKNKTTGSFTITLTKPTETRIIRVRLDKTVKTFEVEIRNTSGQVTMSQRFNIDGSGSSAVLNGATIWSDARVFPQDGLFISANGALHLYFSGQGQQILSGTAVGREFVSPRPLRYKLQGAHLAEAEKTFRYVNPQTRTSMDVRLFVRSSTPGQIEIRISRADRGYEDAFYTTTLPVPEPMSTDLSAAAERLELIINGIDLNYPKIVQTQLQAAFAAEGARLAVTAKEGAFTTRSGRQQKVWVVDTTSGDHHAYAKFVAGKLADGLLELYSQRKSADEFINFVLFTGTTPKEAYPYLAQDDRLREVWPYVRFFHLDEYVYKLAPGQENEATDVYSEKYQAWFRYYDNGHKATFKTYLEKNFFDVLNSRGIVIRPDQKYFVADHCRGRNGFSHYSGLIGQNLTLMGNGFGKSGHIAFVDEETSATDGMRVHKLRSDTVAQNRSDNTLLDNEDYQYAVTLGPLEFSRAKKIISCASGGKRDYVGQVVQKAFLGPVDPMFSSSFLQTMPQVELIVDPSVAKALGVDGARLAKWQIAFPATAETIQALRDGEVRVFRLNNLPEDKKRTLASLLDVTRHEKEEFVFIAALGRVLALGQLIPAPPDAKIWEKIRQVNQVVKARGVAAFGLKPNVEIGTEDPLLFSCVLMNGASERDLDLLIRVMNKPIEIQRIGTHHVTKMIFSAPKDNTMTLVVEYDENGLKTVFAAARLADAVDLEADLRSVPHPSVLFLVLRKPSAGDYREIEVNGEEFPVPFSAIAESLIRLQGEGFFPKEWKIESATRRERPGLLINDEWFSGTEFVALKDMINRQLDALRGARLATEVSSGRKSASDLYPVELKKEGGNFRIVLGNQTILVNSSFPINVTKALRVWHTDAVKFKVHAGEWIFGVTTGSNIFIAPQATPANRTSFDLSSEADLGRLVSMVKGMLNPEPPKATAETASPAAADDAIKPPAAAAQAAPVRKPEPPSQPASASAPVVKPAPTVSPNPAPAPPVRREPVAPEAPPAKKEASRAEKIFGNKPLSDLTPVFDEFAARTKMPVVVNERGAKVISLVELPGIEITSPDYITDHRFVGFVLRKSGELLYFHHGNYIRFGGSTWAGLKGHSPDLELLEATLLGLAVHKEKRTTSFLISNVLAAKLKTTEGGKFLEFFNKTGVITLVSIEEIDKDLDNYHIIWPVETESGAASGGRLAPSSVISASFKSESGDSRHSWIPAQSVAGMTTKENQPRTSNPHEVGTRLAVGLLPRLSAGNPLMVPVANSPRPLPLTAYTFGLAPNGAVSMSAQLLTLSTPPSMGVLRSAPVIASTTWNRNALLRQVQDISAREVASLTLPRFVRPSLARNEALEPNVRALIQDLLVENEALRSLPGWQGRAGNIWSGIFNNLTASVVGQTPGLVTALVLPYVSNEVDLKATIKILDTIAKARGLKLVIYLAHQGEISQSASEKLEALKTERSSLALLTLAPNERLMNSVAQKMAADNIKSGDLAQVIVGADVKAILESGRDNLGLTEVRAALQSKLHLFGIEESTTSKQTLSFADMVHAGMATVFENLGIPTRLGVRFEKVMTPFGFEIYVVRPIALERELKIARLAKQAESAA